MFTQRCAVSVFEKSSYLIRQKIAFWTACFENFFDDIKIATVQTDSGIKSAACIQLHFELYWFWNLFAGRLLWVLTRLNGSCANLLGRWKLRGSTRMHRPWSGVTRCLLAGFRWRNISIWWFVGQWNSQYAARPLHRCFSRNLWLLRRSFCARFSGLTHTLTHTANKLLPKSRTK